MHSFTNPRNVITDTDWFNVQVLVSKLISKSREDLQSSLKVEIRTHNSAAPC